jgi:hypothetical protein
MIARLLKSRTVLMTALILMFLGFLDPLEGAVVILIGVALAGLHARLTMNRNKVMVYWASVFIAVGIVAMIALSLSGGLGGKSGRSLWWGLLILPYPIGWIVGLVGGIRMLVEEFKHPHGNSKIREDGHVRNV